MVEKIEEKGPGSDSRKLEPAETPGKGTPLLYVRDLRVTEEQGGTCLLTLPALDLYPGECVSIVGPSGAGKSTLLKSLARLTMANLQVSGTYLYEGQDAYAIPVMNLRQSVSYCFQNPLLFGESVRDNLAFPAAIRKTSFDEARACRLLCQSGLSADFLDRPISQLSGGERQRIALIRNLMVMPRVLLLDEITSSLDQENAQKIWAWLGACRDRFRLSYIFVSHDPAEQAMADRKVSIEKRPSHV